MLTVTVIDEWSPGKVTPEWALDLLRERITARELIRRRIHQEVMDYNARMPGRCHSLVQPSDSERVLNGYHLQDGRTIDWRAQSDQAQEAFQRHRSSCSSMIIRSSGKATAAYWNIRATSA